MNAYYYLYEYRPVNGGNATPEQVKVRNDVFAFKEGACPENVMNDMVGMVRKITGNDFRDWTVCFIPAASLETSVSRYYELSSRLSDEFPGIVYLNTLELSTDYDALLEETRKITCNAARVRGKKVLVIDDILNTGSMFEVVSDLLLRSGASQVTGLFIAKVVRD